MKKIKLNGKQLSEHNSSFVEFFIDESMTDEEFKVVENVKDDEEFSCYESLWIGTENSVNSIMIGYDDSESSDFKSMKELIDKESMEMIMSTKENYDF